MKSALKKLPQNQLEKLKQELKFEGGLKNTHGGHLDMNYDALAQSVTLV